MSDDWKRQTALRFIQARDDGSEPIERVIRAAAEYVGVSVDQVRQWRTSGGR